MLYGQPALLQEFVNEAREHLALVGEDILNLEKEGSDKLQDRIDRLFRAMHSVKGGAAVIGCQQRKSFRPSRIQQRNETSLRLKGGAQQVT